MGDGRTAPVAPRANSEDPPGREAMRAASARLCGSDLGQLAYHEAGHALLGLIEPQADQPFTASIFANRRSYGPALSDPQRERQLPGERCRRGRITGLLGGLAAECVIDGDQPQQDESDLAEALAAAGQPISTINDAATQAFTTLVPHGGEIQPLELGCLQGTPGEGRSVVVRAVEGPREARLHLGFQDSGAGAQVFGKSGVTGDMSKISTEDRGVGPREELRGGSASREAKSPQV
jgi:hypothetical protein